MMIMQLPTEPIGSIPRPKSLLEGMSAFSGGRISQGKLNELYDAALRDTIRLFEETGSSVITDGEQTKPSFVTYPIHGLKDLAPDGVVIPFADGHTRRLPRLTAGPFRYQAYASQYLETAKKIAKVPVKQAVISASALSLLYPQEGLKGYSREAFLKDLVLEHETDIRRCLKAGAHKVQVDFTEGRLAVKLDPTKALLKSFIDLNNRAFRNFTKEERVKIGVHTCPGGDADSTHSADVDYTELLPDLFRMNVDNFYIQLASEKDRRRVLKVLRGLILPHQKIFVGVIDPINPRIESAEEVRDRILEAAEFIPMEQLGTTDDCGFSPFCDDTSTSRESAFAKIRARILGTQMVTPK